MKCGFFELDITPALGCIMPGDFGARYAEDILDPLYVRAIAVRDGDTGLAVASIDATGITADITERIRARVAQRIPLHGEQIMVAATHAHGCGPTLNWGEEVRTDEHYLRCLVERTADAIVCAWKKADDAEMLLGREELRGVSFVRVYRMKDGSLKTNPSHKSEEDIAKIDAPCTDIDPEVLVLAARRGDEYLGAVVNFATHPATMAGKKITGDYISILSREMKKIFGQQFVTVFINGACGNINHINPFDPATFTNPSEIYTRVGTKLAEKSAEAIRHAAPMQCETLAAKVSTLEVKFRKPTPEMLANAKDWFTSLGDNLAASVPGTKDYRTTFFALQTFLIQADKRTVRSMDLQLLRIGDFWVFGNPCQIFVEYGRKIKEACGGYCVVSAFANDYCGYVPAPEYMREGVYEATLAPTSALEPAAGDKVADRLIAMHQEMNK